MFIFELLHLLHFQSLFRPPKYNEMNKRRLYNLKNEYDVIAIPFMYVIDTYIPKIFVNLRTNQMVRFRAALHKTYWIINHKNHRVSGDA